LGFDSFPSSETMNPIVMPKNTIKAHFFGLQLISYSQHFSKHFYNLDKCVFKTLKTMKSSKKSFIVIQVILESFTHHSLVGRWRIFESKWHHHLNKHSPIYNECHLIMALGGNLNLMVSGKTIQNEYTS
jgi:hypothetical protein